MRWATTRGARGLLPALYSRISLSNIEEIIQSQEQNLSLQHALTLQINNHINNINNKICLLLVIKIKIVHFLILCTCILFGKQFSKIAFLMLIKCISLFSIRVKSIQIVLKFESGSLISVFSYMASFNYPYFVDVKQAQKVEETCLIFHSQQLPVLTFKFHLCSA